MATTLIILGLTIGIVGIFLSQSSRNAPQTKLIETINAPVDTAFNYIVPVDLTHIFKGYKWIAGITNASIKEGWTQPGLVRTVYFEDGSTSKESLLTVIPNTSFSYKNEEFTSQLRFFAKRIEGDWIFTDLCNGQTKIEWTYKVIPHNFIAQILVNALLMKNIKGLLTNALIILKNDLETDKYKSATH
jgi:hypothetical protein